MSLSKKYQAQMAEHAAKVQAIVQLATEQNRDVSADEQTEIDNCHKSIADLEPKAKQMAEVEAKAASILSMSGHSPSFEIGNNKHNKRELARAGQKPKYFDTREDAFLTGQFCLAVLFGNEKAKQWCSQNDVPLIQNAHSTQTNTAGGYLVPEVMETAIINLKEVRGVARRNAFVYPMSGGSVTIPRRNSGFTVYYPGEGSEGTESDLSFSQVRLEARKAMVLTALTNELAEDEVVGLAEIVVSEMAYSFANAEDEGVFLGDGTQTYGGIVGLKNSLNAGSIVTAAAGDDTFAELLVDFFEEAVGKLPEYPGIMPKWYVSKTMFVTAMGRLQGSGGGNDKQSIAAAFPREFMGYPVEYTQVLPKVTTTLASTIVGFFGDLSMCGTMGSRRGITIATDSSLYFKSDMLAIRGTQRWDWNGHEKGTATEAGPMIALKMGTA